MSLRVGGEARVKCVWMKSEERAEIIGYTDIERDHRPVTGTGEAVPDKKGLIVHLRIGKHRYDGLLHIDTIKPL